jgi:hypothetical protein
VWAEVTPRPSKRVIIEAMKRKAEYVEGPEASANFERTMRGLFQIPRSETPERPKRAKKRKKSTGKAAH